MVRFGSDLLIEQTLMRSVKSTGGLTRGSGMTEEMRDTWVLAAPALSEYNMTMQDFTGQTYATSEQHRESTDARKVRDSNDFEKIDTKVKQCQPFSNHNSLRNIVNGLVAAENVNVDSYREIGDRIVGNMIGKSVFDHKFKRKDRQCTAEMLTSQNDIICLQETQHAMLKPIDFHSPITSKKGHGQLILVR